MPEIFHLPLVLTLHISLARYPNKRSAVLLRPEHVYHTPTGVVCLQRGTSPEYSDALLDSNTLDFQVIEQFFFSHESFSIQRHVLFTTAILLSSMIRKSILCLVLPLLSGSSSALDSIPNNMRSRRDAGNHRWRIRHSSRIHLARRMLSQTRAHGLTMVF